MSKATDPKEPFEAPVGKQDRKKREKVKKVRVHIYVSEDSLDKIDNKAEELGLDRSPCIQMLLNVGLNHLESSNDGVFNTGKRVNEPVFHTTPSAGK